MNPGPCHADLLEVPRNQLRRFWGYSEVAVTSRRPYHSLPLFPGVGGWRRSVKDWISAI